MPPTVRPLSPRLALLLALCLLGGSGMANAQPNNPSGGVGGAPGEDWVTIYRCTDAQGRLSLRDSPCGAGQRQETRRMQRPNDAPARPVSAPAAAVASAESNQQTRLVLVQPPRPMYECVTPDGERYLSDTAEGNPRLVPQWANGAPMWTAMALPSPDASGPPPPGGAHPPRPAPVIGYTAMVWVRDACAALPQREVCDRLRDRREDLRRRFFNAQPSERAMLDREERSIGAHLDNDCR